MKARLSALAGALAVGGVSAAIALAPMAGAQPPGEDHNNPLLPGCEVTGGGGGMQGGETTDCASPGNVQVDSTPSIYFPWSGGMYYGGFL